MTIRYTRGRKYILSCIKVHVIFIHLRNFQVLLEKSHRSHLQTFAMQGFILLTFSIFISASANFCENRFAKRLQTLNLIDQQLQYVWYQLGQEVVNTKQNIIEAQAKSNKINWAVIAGVIGGNILRLAGRVSRFFSFCKLQIS